MKLSFPQIKIIPVIIFFSAIIFSNNIFAQTDSTATDSLLLKQVEQQMQSNTTNATTEIPQQTRSTLTANPDIGVVGDFQSSYISRGKKNYNAYLNESEISLQSVVDPYIRADFFLSFERDPTTGKYGVDVEEGYLTTLSLPAKLQLKVGKFREAVGRINPVHPHALPFIDLPNAYVNYFGDGLNDEGASLSWLLPNKAFYQEFTFQATAGLTETPTFMQSEGNRFNYLAHLKNFFALNDNATLELGLTGISGPNPYQKVTNMAAADLTYKWKPLTMNTYKSVTWQSEFYYSHANDSSFNSMSSFGLYTFLEDQISKRWFLTARYDYAEKPYDRAFKEQAYSLTAGWLATEFSKIEFEGKTTDDNLGRFYQGWIRWIFVIGAHGAHQY